MNWLTKIARPEILSLKAYSSARNEYSGYNQIQLDANENPERPYGDMRAMLNRYPEPQPLKLKQKLAEIYDIKIDQLLITRGMDEGIDLLIRTFCRPYQDSIIVTPPTFGYYAVSGCINAVNIIEVPLLLDFSPNWVKLKKLDQTKIIFLCTPNNPTGTVIPITEIKAICEIYNQKTLIVIDEAYIEFSDALSATTLLETCPNLVVMRTLSKAYALAGVRIGSIIANADIIKLLTKVIPPYPIPRPCAEICLNSLSPIGIFYAKNKIEKIKQQRKYLAEMLIRSNRIKKVYPSEANFILIIAIDADNLYQDLKQKGIVVRNRSQDIPSALRITVGTPEENNLLLIALGILAFEQKTSIRRGSKSRKTNETEIFCEVLLDNKGSVDIQTGIGFFDHMLEQLAKHSGISINIRAIGDTHIDAHHTVEDVAIVLGQALKEALGNKLGMIRYGFLLPMDEAEARVSIDLSGRGYCRFDAAFRSAQVGYFPTEMISHFFKSLSDNLGAAIHISATGENTHHMIESIFKCMAKALGQAVAILGDQLPSTKGMI